MKNIIQHGILTTVMRVSNNGMNADMKKRNMMMRRFCNFMTGVCFLGVIMLAAIEPHDAPAVYIHAAMLTILSIGMAFFGITARSIRD